MSTLIYFHGRCRYNRRRFACFGETNTHVLYTSAVTLLRLHIYMHIAFSIHLHIAFVRAFVVHELGVMAI